MKKPYRQDEHILQVAIVSLLRENNISFFAVPNGGKRNIKVAMKLKAEGVKSGVADLVLLLEWGETIFIELKTPKGKQSDTQKNFETLVTGLGFNYYVIRSVDEMKKLIKNTIKTTKWEKET